MTRHDETITPEEGVRERKRRETLRRITDTGMRLFIQNGFEATTLDEIAAEAGISRRTFFYYFKSKDDILLSLQAGMGEMIVARLLDAPRDQRPLDAIRDAIVQVCAPFPAGEILAIDRLMRSNEVVQARKQASYIQHEKVLFEALRAMWPAPERETALRLVAMMAIGAMRLAFEALSREEARRPIAELLHETFAALKTEI